ncbi:MAG: gliding motility-associated C-terminal domain-containing protein [Bacteroidales bacterium]|nr:gliding motility-associated C-terminal domain-containing protein [Bacteroidales bacterium]
MLRFYICSILCLISIWGTTIAQKDPIRSGEIEFIENKGQWNEKIIFKTDLHHGALFLEKDCFTFNFVDHDDLSHSHAHDGHVFDKKTGQITHYHAYKMNFPGADKDVSITGLNATDDYCNYFIGNDHSKWASRVNKYSAIEYTEIYPDIDLKIYSHDHLLKYDFLLKPGANHRDISLEYEGLNDIRISNGNLIIKTSVNKILELKPFTYQEVNGKIIEIACRYQLKKNKVTFQIKGKYDKSKTLIIDPTLIFSTYTGSTADNWGFTATFDYFGNVYSGGIVSGTGYPTSTGAFQVDHAGQWDVGIIKYDSLGLTRLFATYLGGLLADIPHSLIVNELDELLVLGTTGSADFPTSLTAYDITFNGGDYLAYDGSVLFTNGSDIYVTKFSPDGSQLMASTFIGGTGNDGLNFRHYYNFNVMHGNDSLYYNYGDGARGEIITDDLNNVYVGSSTFSNDFPVTGFPFQSVYNGQQEGVVFKLDYNLTTLVWSSYIGGSADDAVFSIDTDKNYDILIAGGTNSSDFPTTPGAYQPNYLGGTADAFVAHISQNGNNLIGSTFFGSSDYDQAYFVRADKSNNVFITGQTEAPGSTLIHNALYNRPNSGQFVAKFPPSLNTLEWSTVFGTGNGKPNISPTAFAVDICNRIYVCGWGREWAGYDGNTWANIEGTKNLDITPGAFQDTTDGMDFYFMVIGVDGNSLEYASFFGEIHEDVICGYSGHDHVDGGTSRFDKRGNIYQSVCASCGGCNAFPTFPAGVWSSTNNSFNCNNAVFKFNINYDFALAEFSMPHTGCAPFTVQFDNNSIGTSYIWNFGDGSPTSTTPNPTHTYNNSGLYNITLIANNPASCNLSDTIIKQIQILDDTSYSIPEAYLCKGDQKQIGITPSIDTTIKYQWIPSNGISDITVANPFASPAVTTNYTLLVSNGVCTDTIYQDVIVFDLKVFAGNDTTACAGTVFLTATAYGDSVNFIWSSNPQFSDTLNSNVKDSTVLITITSLTTFYVKINNEYCEATDSINVDFLIVISPIVADDPSCHGFCDGIASVLASSGTLPYTYLWNTGATTDTISSLCAGTYTCTVTDANLCFSISSITLTDPPPLLIDIDSVNIPCDEVCIGEALANISGGVPPYSYIWSNGQITNPAVDLCAGKYYVTITDDNKCIITDFTTIIEDPILKNIVVYVDDDTIYSGQSTNIYSTEIPNCQYTWKPVAGLSNANIPDPVASPLVTTTYYLNIQDQYGCEYIDSVKIFVIDVFCEEPYIFVPNAFTPNGDNNNDIVFVRGNIIEDMYIAIYNRWGEKVFESTKQENGWDGTYKGEKSPPGVFVYYLDITCYGKRTFRKKGNITLIR